MDERKLKWTRKAFKQYASIVQWYSINVGKQAASSFVKSVMYANEQMLKYPTIGMLHRERTNSRYEYRSYLIHPKYRILYRISKKIVGVVAFHCNLKENSNIK